MIQVIGVVGGLGLFLFGMIFMSDALQRVAGSQLKSLLAALTKKKFYAVIIGIIVTIVLQSSSATTVMTVGFVNAGLLNLNQAIGIIMGSNIGTTVVTQLISFNFEIFAPLIIAVSVALFLVFKDKKLKNTANILIGFGILLMGMGLMKDAIAPLRDSQAFAETIVRFNNPLFGLMIGLVITAILQSSAATAGILIAVAGSGFMDIGMAFPVLLGSNIGTCVTALLSSIGTNKTAKRAAMIHVIIKVIGAAAFLAYLRFPVQNFVAMIDPFRIERQIANANTIFNVITVLMVYPVSHKIVDMSYKFVKGSDELRREDLRYVNDGLIQTPDLAVVQLKKEIIRVFNIVEKQLVLSKKTLLDYDKKLCLYVLENEIVINKIEAGLFEYIIKLTGQSLSGVQIDKVATMSKTLTDLERVADLAENLTELSMVTHDNKMDFSEDARKELEILFDKVIEIYLMTRNIFETEDLSEKDLVLSMHNDIDSLSEDFQISHVNRVRNQISSTQSEIVFLDALGNLERISNHSKNIVQSVARLSV
ncbi:MAG: Na/Pi cotransporter family protein [Dethiosulfatibacter sp.]|nr:Na/Pi cotransporter family protein [Dethiosulfatibacter sp.]